MKITKDTPIICAECIHKCQNYKNGCDGADIVCEYYVNNETNKKRVKVGDVAYEVKDDILYRNIVEEVYSSGLYIIKKEQILDKESFIECYKTWIKGE